MAAWSSPRFVAPTALIAALLAFVVVVATSGVEQATPEPTLMRTTSTQTTSASKPQARAYVVKPGDNLTVIAEKTGVAIETIERLNPDLDSQALLVGERLKLAP